ncbi:MFS transporter [Streptomyces eurythermus]|uniref:MFS transporter n=1 Tax=Streptomyces eurythermus TaxID=42237 RepID=UPI00279FAF28|nr:MFS transporter [Streptomyces lavenduligriseus]
MTTEATSGNPTGAMAAAQSAPEPADNRISGRQAWALAVLGCGLFLATLDLSIVYVALPSIGEDLALPESRLQWIVSGYAIFFAGFLLVGGRTGDRFGARRVFLGATALFGASSLAAALTQDFTTLVVARALQGIGAGLLDPATLGLIQQVFPPGPKRNRAMAVWGAVGAIGLVGGVALGGLLTTVSWQWVFLVNVPIAAAVIAAGLFLLPGRRTDAAAPTPLNALSGILGTGAILLLVLGLTRLGDAGWSDPATLVGLAGFVVLAALWVVRERTSASPLIARELWRTRSLMVACAVDACYVLSIGVEFFLVTLFLQDQRGFSPLAAGLGFLPLTVTVIIGNAVTDRLVGRHGPRTMVMGGLLLAAIGLGLLAVGVHSDSYAIGVLPGLLLSGLGNGIAFPAMFIAATSEIPGENQGVGAALVTTTQNVFQALGLAVLVILLGAHPGTGNFTTTFAATGAMALLGTLVAAAGLRGPLAGKAD